MSEVLKKCTKCGEEQPRTAFYPAKIVRNGLRPRCKSCDKLLAQEWRKRNRARVLATVKEWIRKNPTKVAVLEMRRRKKHPHRTRDWHRANPEKSAQGSKRWGDAHPAHVAKVLQDWKKNNLARVSAIQAARKARQRSASPAWANKFYIDEIYALAQLRTKHTGIEHHVDHIVPLKSHLVCGLHVEHNLRVIPKIDNSSKGNRVWPDMPEQRV